MAVDEQLAKEATDALTRLVDEHGSTELTVEQLLGMLGYEQLTHDVIDDVWDVLRGAGLREEPLLTKEGLTLISKVKIRRIQNKREREERSFITWGFVTAVLFAPVALIFGIRLLVRERVGPGLAVIFTAIAVWGVGIALVVNGENSKSGASAPAGASPSGKEGPGGTEFTQNGGPPGTESNDAVYAWTLPTCAQFQAHGTSWFEQAAKVFAQHDASQSPTVSQSTLENAYITALPEVCAKSQPTFAPGAGVVQSVHSKYGIE